MHAKVPHRIGRIGFLPPASAVEVIKSVPCFRLLVSTLTAEPFEVRTLNLVQ